MSYEWGEYRKRMQAAEHQTGMLGWTGDNGDPDNFLAVLLGCNAEGKPNGNNIPKWCNAEFQEVVNKAAEISDQAERTKLYQQRPGDRRGGSAVGEHRPLHRVRADPQVGDGLQGEPARRHEFQNVDIAE